MSLDVTVVTPTIPPRAGMLAECVRSVALQSAPARAHSIAVDTGHEGAWVTRQRALDAVLTGWVQFLDDDDQLYEDHLAALGECAEASGADYVFSYWDTTRSWDVLGHFGKPFDVAHPHHTTMTVLCRTELARSVGFGAPAARDIASGEDWRFILGCCRAGAKIVHLPQQTWYWRHHSGNTSGQPRNW